MKQLILKKIQLDNLTNEYNMVLNEINNLSENSLDKELNKVIEDYYNHEQEKHFLKRI